MDENDSLFNKYSHQSIFADEREKHLNELLGRVDENDNSDNDNHTNNNNETKREKRGSDTKPWKLGYS